METRICRCGRKLYVDVHYCPSCGQPMDLQPAYHFYTLECSVCGKNPVTQGRLRSEHKAEDPCPCPGCAGKLFRPDSPRYENS